MTNQIFINLAVKDLQKSTDFYIALGFSVNQQFSDDSGKCMVWSEKIFVMLLSHEKFKTFATKPIADTKSKLAGLFALSVDNLESVNSIMTKGLQAGGIVYASPKIVQFYSKFFYPKININREFINAGVAPGMQKNL